MAALGYVDDRAFAAARAAALGRRGYGERRVGEALRAAGIDEEDGAEARQAARDGAWTAALRFAERRRIGPFAAAEADRAAPRQGAGGDAARRPSDGRSREAARRGPTGRNPGSGQPSETAYGSQIVETMIVLRL